MYNHTQWKERYYVTIICLSAQFGRTRLLPDPAGWTNWTDRLLSVFTGLKIIWIYCFSPDKTVLRAIYNAFIKIKNSFVSKYRLYLFCILLFILFLLSNCFFNHLQITIKIVTRVTPLYFMHWCFVTSQTAVSIFISRKKRQEVIL